MYSYVERVESAINELRQGKIIILTDHPERENEGDFIFPAATITPEMMNFIIRNSSGIVCLALCESTRKKLDLPYMASPGKMYSHGAPFTAPFTISIDARYGTTTGVSAADRVKTIQAALHDHARPEDLVRPGHIFPLCAKAGGVLERAGHTEGAVDLMNLAGFKPAAVLCEVMNPDGTMTRGKQLLEFSKQHNITVLSIADIISYRLRREDLIAEEISAELPLEHQGAFTITVFKEKMTGNEHVVLEKKPEKTATATLVRIHSACLTGDLFGSLRCDCHHQLHYSLQRISEEGGMLIYLNQEGRGIGLFNKIKAYALQEKGLDTIEANERLGLPVDSRKYYIAANVLRNRGISQVRLLTNNPAKINDLKKYGIAQVEAVPVPVFSNEHNKNYLHVKMLKLHHIVGRLA